MTEAFLHHIWKYRLYSKTSLATTEGEPVEVLRPGQHNTDAGPDFLDALVKIGSTKWAGHVEIHLKSSAWISHRHHLDSAYDNVVLHVVYENDADVGGNAGSMATLELKERFDVRLWENYNELVASLQWIACSHRLEEVPETTVYNWLDVMAAERLQLKTEAVRSLLDDCRQDWEEAFYRRLCYTFGLKVNAEPFLSLARSLPLPVVQKHRDSLLQVEALLYGQAGMLEGRQPDSYSRNLLREYRFLKTKFRLEPMPYASWKFLRLRPPAFPTVRLAQLAGLLHRQPNLFSRVLEAANYSSLKDLFEGTVSEYWKTHYRFGKDSPATEKDTGENFFQAILVNAVIPFLFAYGRWKNNEELCRRALAFLEKIPPEDNKVIRTWEENGVAARHAAHTQGLLHLKSAYCEEKKCVNCSIGYTLISKIP